jgi:hypothetical protein
MCGCNSPSPMSAMTSAEVNAMLASAQQQAAEAARREIESMVASAQRAVANAGGGTTTPVTQ